MIRLVLCLACTNMALECLFGAIEASPPYAWFPAWLWVVGYLVGIPGWVWLGFHVWREGKYL